MPLIGERIRRLRNEAELTQQEFGVLFGVANSTVSQWEIGTNEPDAEMLVKIVERFRVSLDWLVGRTDAREGKATPLPDLSKRWPALSSDRRGKAFQLERMVDTLHIPPDMLDADFDLFYTLVIAQAKAVLEAQRKRAPGQ